MLVDVRFYRPAPDMGFILGMIGGSQGPLIPERIERGLYRCGHWSVEQVVPVFDLLDDEWELPDEIPSGGVCDYPRQLLEKFPAIAEIETPFFATFVHIRRADQPLEGGWRWHKWGDYIGNREPMREYLHDEPEIEEVHTFSIHQPKRTADIIERVDA